MHRCIPTACVGNLLELARHLGLGLSSCEGTADVSVLDIPELHGGILVLLLELGGVAGLEGARPGGDAGVCDLVFQVELLPVEPQHPAQGVVPDGHAQDHAAVQRFPHGLESPVLAEDPAPRTAGGVEGLILGLALRVGQGPACVILTESCRLGILDDLAVLQPDSAYLGKVAGVSAVLRDELCHHCHRLTGIHLEVGTLSKELLVTHAPRVEAAALLVAQARQQLAALVAALFRSIATVQALHLCLTGVCREGCSLPVPFKDVHLGTTGPVLAHGTVLLGLA
mmetsp:Transcript_16675/g.45262  ORF Transcript_16675/g.45262 Transcript_16675/m.45262 type:complete len:283 (-) Transcript_16675:752-1600(-)